jgi:arylformamidase
MRLPLALTLPLFTVTLLAAEYRIHRNLPYNEPRDASRLLDVYHSTDSTNAPVVVWIHGGGWQSGDKSDVAAKPWAFVDHGFVFVSVNYRFIPAVTMTQIAQDVAKAVGWSHAHAKDYGGDPQRMFIMGHSAGASLTALLCTDERYLKAEGTPLSAVKGCVPVDGDAFDVPMQVQTVEERRKQSFRSKFGDPESQKALSAVTYIAPGKFVPPFLILRVADPKGAAMRTETGSPCCPETDVQADRLAKALSDAGVPVKIVPGAGKNHTTLDAGLGLPGDKPTEALFEFLSGVLGKR